MLAATDPVTIVEAAEQAAARGDHATAEECLRRAATLQEAQLGPLHPDLANTLNNLGVVCEITGKPADAEAFYRRAYEIAQASLPPEHPFVATSRKNLEDFRGVRDFPTERTAVVATSSAPPPASGRPRALTIGAAIVVLALVAYLMRPSSTPEATNSTSASPVAESSDVTPALSRETAPDTPPAARTTAAPTVMIARLCRGLDTSGAEWRCDPVDAAVSPGPVFFYTRVASTTDAVVEHRWYQGDRLHQRFELRIGANQGGYRTYSRNTVTPERTGDWKVELRTRDGRVLHEERFTVR